jgi:hypothetical protein
MVEGVIQALRSPYGVVRRVAMETIGSLSPSANQLERSVSILNTGLERFSFRQKASAYLKKAFTGVGQVGVDLSEKIDLIQALRRLDAHKPEDLEARLLSLVDTDSQYFAKVVEVLAGEFDHELDSKIVSRLIQAYCKYERVPVTTTALGTRIHTVHTGGDLRQSLTRLVRRFNVKDKKRWEKLLLDELMATQSERTCVQILACIRALETGLTSLSKSRRAWILELLGHRNWYVADAAFEVLAQNEII